MPSDIPVIRVVGRQFSWHFHYPGGDGLFGESDHRLVEADNPAGIDWSSTAAADDFVSSELVLLIAAPVILDVTSYDVIHGVSGLPDSSRQDAIPGKRTSMFVPAEPKPIAGILKCDYPCGAGHDDHRAAFKFVDADQYERWVDAHQHARQ